MAEGNPMTQVGDTVTIKLPRERHVRVVLATVSAARGFTANGSQVVLEVSYDGGISWVNAKLERPDSTGTLDGLLGPGLAAEAAGGGATHARARLAAIVSGQAIAILDWRGHGDDYSGPIVSDSFNRANNALSLGSADTGQPWSAVVGTWGISSNQAYCPTNVGNSIAVVDAGVSNGMVQVTTAVIVGGDIGLVARLTDGSNYIRAIFEGGTWFLQKCVAGVFTTLASAAGAQSAGDILQLSFGSLITLRQNGVLLLSSSDAFNQSATKAGLTVISSAATFDNFAVYR